MAALRNAGNAECVSYFAGFMIPRWEMKMDGGAPFASKVDLGERPVSVGPWQGRMLIS